MSPFLPGFPLLTPSLVDSPLLASTRGSEGPWAQAFASSLCGSPSIYAAEQPGDGETFPPRFPS